MVPCRLLKEGISLLAHLLHKLAVVALHKRQLLLGRGHQKGEENTKNMRKFVRKNTEEGN